MTLQIEHHTAGKVTSLVNERGLIGFAISKSFACWDEWWRAGRSKLVFPLTHSTINILGERREKTANENKRQGYRLMGVCSDGYGRWQKQERCGFQLVRTTRRLLVVMTEQSWNGSHSGENRSKRIALPGRAPRPWRGENKALRAFEIPSSHCAVVLLLNFRLYSTISSLCQARGDFAKARG